MPCGDVVRMGRQHIRDGMLAVRQEKTGVALSLPVRPELAEIIAATPTIGVKTFLVTRTGRQFAGTVFSEQFRAWCRPSVCTSGVTAVPGMLPDEPAHADP